MKPGMVLPAAELPVGTVVTAGPSHLSKPVGDQVTVLTKTDRPGRCPWRLGGPQSLRFVANWRVQQFIADGARVNAGPGSGTAVAG
jgi:hypothetical protein